MSRVVLVTGGAGFIGSHLAAALLARGDQVCAADSVENFHGTSLALLGVEREIEHVRIDVTDRDEVKRLMRRRQWDAVVHLAAQPISVLSNRFPDYTMRVNVEGTRAVFDTARDAGVGCAVLASSACRFGLPDRGSAPLREDDPARPGFYVYSASKLKAEEVLRTVPELRRGIGRFVNVYGGGDRHFSRIIPKLVRSLARDEPLVLTRGNGQTVLDYLYIDDAVRGLLVLLDHVSAHADLSQPHVFNFGVAGDNPVSVTQLAEAVSLQYDGTIRPLKVPDSPPEPPVVKYLDPTKAQRLLAWRAETRLVAGLRKTIDWYLAHLHELAGLEDHELPAS